MRQTSNLLKDAGAGFAPWQFVLLGRLMGRAGEIKAGSYEVNAGVTPYQLLGKLARGDVSMGEIVFVEGKTFADWRAAIAAQPDLQHDSASLSEGEILRRIGATENHIEGLMFPDTYWFAKNGSDVNLLRHSYRLMQSRLQSEWEKRDASLPYRTPYEALIMASIVEKETGQATDRAAVAAVFVNRLSQGMALQTDPTVIYGLGDALRRQPAQARPARRYALQHLHAARPAADADRHAGPGVAARGAASLPDATCSISSRAATAPASFRARSTSTTGPWSVTSSIAEDERCAARFITLRRHRRRRQEHPPSLAGGASARQGQDGGADARAGRTPTRREAARAAAGRTDAPGDRGAADVRGAARTYRPGDRTRAARAATGWCAIASPTPAFAYQGGGRGLAANKLEILERWVQAGLEPDRTFLFDIDPALARQRLTQTGNAADRFELEREEFFARVRAAYLERATSHADRIVVLDANRSIEDIKETLEKYIISV